MVTERTVVNKWWPREDCVRGFTVSTLPYAVRRLSEVEIPKNTTSHSLPSWASNCPTQIFLQYAGAIYAIAQVWFLAIGQWYAVKTQ